MPEKNKGVCVACSKCCKFSGTRGHAVVTILLQLNIVLPLILYCKIQDHHGGSREAWKSRLEVVTCFLKGGHHTSLVSDGIST